MTSTNGKWECSHCSFVNYPDLVCCEMCLLYHSDILAKGHPDATCGILPELQTKCFPQQQSHHQTQYCIPFPLHFHQKENWSCGYRNIQMLCSSLMQVEEFRSVLFDGKGKIPTVEELKRWIELSWQAQFDVNGAEHFGYKLTGTKKWIGTTECAALLRYFGLRAIVVDFRTDSSSLSSSRKRKAGSDNDDCMKDRITNWIKRYFVSDIAKGENSPAADKQAMKFPLYFQYMGHSLSVVGGTWEESILKQLIVFDPAMDGREIKSNLRSGSERWKRQLLVDTKSMKDREYQILFVLPGIMDKVEKERSKTIIGLSDREAISSNI